MALNTNTSIVDYLKSIGQDNSFSNRANIYKSSGLNMGNYTGSAQQNVALLNHLKSSGGGSAPQSPQPGSASPAPAASPTSGGSRQDYARQMADELTRKDQEYQAKVQADRQKLIDYYASLEDPTSRYTRLRGEQGVDTQEALVNALGTQVLDVDKLIKDLEPSVNQRTGDFLVDEADRTAILSKERLPHQKDLIDLLEQKQREEVGLSNKYNLVQNLLEMSFRGDEMKARPLQLGVDYSNQEREAAINLLRDVIGMKTSAFNADMDTTERRQDAATDFARQLEMEMTSHNNTLSRQAAAKAKSPGESLTEEAWGEIVSAASRTGDEVGSIADQIRRNTKNFEAAGVDVGELWKRMTERQRQLEEDQAGGYY